MKFNFMPPLAMTSNANTDACGLAMATAMPPLSGTRYEAAHCFGMTKHAADVLKYSHLTEPGRGDGEPMRRSPPLTIHCLGADEWSSAEPARRCSPGLHRRAAPQAFAQAETEAEIYKAEFHDTLSCGSIVRIICDQFAAAEEVLEQRLGVTRALIRHSPPSTIRLAAQDDSLAGILHTGPAAPVGSSSPAFHGRANSPVGIDQTGPRGPIRVQLPPEWRLQQT